MPYSAKCLELCPASGSIIGSLRDPFPQTEVIQVPSMLDFAKFLIKIGQKVHYSTL